MPSKPKNARFNKKQLVFKELFVGTLIYGVVLGFFNDYTNIVDAKSFSTIFMASIVLEILTYLTFLLKDKATHNLEKRVIKLFTIWLILFLSKFVFIWVIDLLFGTYMNIHGFFGVLLLVLCVTIIQQLADTTFTKLGE